MTAKDLEEKTRNNRREFLSQGMMLGSFYLSQPILKALDWVHKWAYPTEEQGHGKWLWVLNKIRIKQNQLYEIIIPDGGSFNLWIENENWIPKEGLGKKIEYGREIFKVINKTAYNIDPFNLKKGDKIRVADLDNNGMVMGLDIKVYMKQGKARKISIDAILGQNSELFWKKYHENKIKKKNVR